MNRIYRTIKIVLVVLVLFVGLSAVFGATVHVAHAEGMIDIAKSGGGGSGDEPGLPSKIIGWILRPFAWAFQAVGTIFLNFSSAFLGKAVDLSIGTSLDTYTGIQVGWQVMRDFANLFFIFIILYIAIKTILQLGDHDTKTMLVRVIAVALLINFSSFFTKAIIDTGNVLATGFYNKIVTSPAPNHPQGGDPTSSKCEGGGNCTIGDRFISILSANSFAKGDQGLTGPLQVSILYFLNGLVFFILGMTLIKGAFYLIARVIAFIFLIIFSPIAFLAYAVPNSKASSFLTNWWSKLLSYTFLAPAYMIIIYLVLQVATGIAAGKPFDVMNYVIIVGLLHFGSKQAFSMADSAGTAMANMGTKYLGRAAGMTAGAATGGLAVAGRNVIGRAGMYTKGSQKLKDFANDPNSGWRGRLARNAISVGDKASKSSFDVTKTGLGGYAGRKLGVSVPGMMQGDGGFKNTGGLERKGLLGFAGFGKHSMGAEEKEKIYKRANELFEKDPVAREAYIKQKSGGFVSGTNPSGGRVGWKDTFTEDKSKEAKGEKAKIENEKFKKTQEKIIEDHIKTLETAGTWTKAKDTALRTAIENNDTARMAPLQAELNAALSSATTAGSTIGAEVKDAMQKLGSRFVGELGEATLGSNIVGAHLSSGDLQQIHRNDMDGKYGSKTLVSEVGKNVFGTGKNSKGTEYLASPEGKKNLFNYSVSSGQVTKTKVYAKNKRLRQKLKRELADTKSDIAAIVAAGGPRTPQEKQDLQKLEDRLEQKEAEYEKKKEDTLTMLS